MAGSAAVRRTAHRRRLGVIATVVALVLVAGACQRIGGASNRFGNDPTASGPQPLLWASINGPYSMHADGDPYSTKCLIGPASGTSCDSSGANPTYNTVGYLWAIEVPPALVGTPVTVAIYDPGHASHASAMGEAVTNLPFATSFRLFDTTGTPDGLDLGAGRGMDALDRCTDQTAGAHVFTGGTAESAIAWYALCTFTPAVSGTYPLQVKSSAIPGVTDSGGGWNNFAIRATAAGDRQPTVAALGNASVFFGTPSSTSKSYLAEVDPSHAGQTMLVDLFDPGDGTSGNASLQVLAPPGGSPAVVPTSGTVVPCSYSPPSVGSGGVTSLDSATCAVQTRSSSASPANLYNNRWLRFAVPIPADYACSTDCWWSLSYQFSQQANPTDRVVYTVSFQ